ncbi:MAG: hypothetical protein LC789_09705 [Actinobacteria bacterium]|nr:hypothetical protein [Actinomycetota bacterium]
MSDVASGPYEGEQPTEEELRAYVAALRVSDVHEIVAQVFSELASAAQVKLGRRDARLLIDLAAALQDAAAARIDERLATQMRTAVDQLRLGQVDAEKQLQQLRSEGRLPAEEEGDLPAAGPATAGATPAGDTPAPDPGAAPPAPSGQSAASRLWVPGR